MSGNETNLVFTENKSSLRARKIITVRHNLTIELWYDKHYYDRYGMREGIDPETVESLVTRSIEHLLFYATVLKGFNFVNYETEPGYASRVVLKEETNGSVLNVVIEVHFITMNRFEVTVTTAMRIDDFRMYTGQYCIEVQQDHSILKKIENGKLSEIFSL